MASRRIPISSNRPPPASGNRGNNATAANTQAPWQSSLDLVFSFSRSQAFFGSNLPSSPSFVARYRRPGFRDDEESSAAPSDRDAERATSEDRDGSIATTDEDWSDDEVGGGQSWDQDGPIVREQLPRNAVNAVKARRSSTRPLRPTETSSIDGLLEVPSPSSHYPTSPPDERSPLVPRKSASNDRLDNRTRAASPRRTPLAAEILATHSKQQSGLSPISSSRRLSIISSEAWKEAIEESRGGSTFGQTLFNTVNVLIGVGLLAEPLAFADAGWVIGTLLLLYCALVTNYTGKMLAKLMSRDSALQTYADVMVKAYGPKARSFIYTMFLLELVALSIALIVLFSDSMAVIFPSWSSTAFKLLGYLIILPTTYLPLRFLSITSLLGICSTITLLVVLLSDGIIKHDSPGSLWQPMQTFAGPRWSRLPLSFGLFMSGFSGHAVIPSLYRDMKDPTRFNSMLNTAYIIAFGASIVMGALGYVMFGDFVSSEVTGDMLATPGYPAVLNQIALWMVALNPVPKYALASGPLILTLEIVLGFRASAPPSSISNSSVVLDGSAIVSEDSASSTSAALVTPTAVPSSSSSPTLNELTMPPPSLTRRIIQFLIRPLMTGLIVVMAILIPDFGRVLSFLGSSSAFLICCIGPIGAYLILGRSKPHKSLQGSRVFLNVSRIERLICWILLIVSLAFALVGTLWTFLPNLDTANQKR